MAKVKVTREDLKRDELRDFGADLLEWYQQRKNLFWIVIGSLLALFVIVRAWSAFNERRQIQANQQYEQAVQAYQRALFTTDAKERETLLKQAEGFAGEVRNRYPGSSAARQALLLQGNTLFLANNPDRARQVFLEYQETASDPDEKATALIALAYCFEDLFARGDMREDVMANSAIEHYVRAADEAESEELKRWAMLGQARMLEFLGQAPQALEIYKKIEEMAQASKERDEQAFINDADRASMKLQAINPADVFNSQTLARQQIERLTALVTAGDKPSLENVLPPASGPTTAPASTAPVAATSTVLPMLEPTETPLEVQPTPQAAVITTPEAATQPATAPALP